MPLAELEQQLNVSIHCNIHCSLICPVVQIPNVGCRGYNLLPSVENRYIINILMLSGLFIISHNMQPNSPFLLQ